MKSITLSKRECQELDDGMQIEFERWGFAMFATPAEYGDFQTPNGTRFMIGFYNPTDYDLEVKYR